MISPAAKITFLSLSFVCIMPYIWTSYHPIHAAWKQRSQARPEEDLAGSLCFGRAAGGCRPSPKGRSRFCESPPSFRSFAEWGDFFFFANGSESSTMFTNIHIYIYYTYIIYIYIYISTFWYLKPSTLVFTRQELGVYFAVLDGHGGTQVLVGESVRSPQMVRICQNQLEHDKFYCASKKMKGARSD